MPPENDKYARLERERRFLVKHSPASEQPPKRIVDHYVIGTSLRLREVNGASRTFKLTQKASCLDPRHARVTNVYLSEDEHLRLLPLATHRLEKTRRIVFVEGERVAVDEFHGALAGLLLAEIEFDDDEAMSRFHPPAWLGIEVTPDERFRGASLAQTTWPDLQRAILEKGRATEG